jgi:hypothetical protein
MPGVTMSMKVIAVILTVAFLVLVPAPALGLGDWDPDDVDGPLDFRWVGGAYTADGTQIRVILGFYDGFRPSALVARHNGSGVLLNLTDFLSGFFRQRRDGQIKFLYGDLGSNCGFESTTCAHVLVRIQGDSVRFNVQAVPVDGADPTYELRARSRWLDENDNRVRDWTGKLDLGLPPGA